MTSGHDECPACGYGLCPATRGEPRPAGCLATLPIAVVAGSRQQFDDYVREHGLEAPRQAVYIDDEPRLLGAYFSRVERVGTWSERKDVMRLVSIALSRVRE